MRRVLFRVALVGLGTGLVWISVQAGCPAPFVSILTGAGLILLGVD